MAERPKKSIQYQRTSGPVPFPVSIPVITNQDVNITFSKQVQFQSKSGIETSFFPERTQLDKWYVQHHNPVLRKTLSVAVLVTASFLWSSFTPIPEVVTIDKWFSRFPDSTSRTRSTPHLYEYSFRGTFPQVPNIASFSVSNPTSTISRKSTPQYYPYLSINSIPIVPNVSQWGMSQGIQIPQLRRMVNYMQNSSNPIVISSSSSRVYTLPLLGVG